MTMLSLRRLAAFGCGLVPASACSHPISRRLRDEAARDNIAFARVLANPDACKGKTVLWGGQIIEAGDVEGGTEFFVLQTRLDFSGVPVGAAS